MVSIDRLVKIYNNFGEREELSPLGSADEELAWNMTLTPKQENWLERFISVWDYTQEKEHEKWQNIQKILKT
jgi:hypothetical protein